MPDFPSRHPRLLPLVTPDLIGGPPATVGVWMPDRVGHDGGWVANVIPYLMRAPLATVGSGCPIESGMTVDG